MTEKTVGYFCGPTLAGIKPSNIVSCYKEQMPDIKEKIVSWNEKLNEKGIYFEPLCECERRILLMVYRKDNMKKILEKTEIAEFLKVYGYIDPKNLEACLCRLKQRISSCEFPHEIGVFLGYPISDIKGFINHRDEGCIFTGELGIRDLNPIWFKKANFLQYCVKMLVNPQRIACAFSLFSEKICTF